MDLKAIFQNVIDGQAPETEAGVKAALEAGISAHAILNQSLIAAMDEVGRRFENGDFFVPEMLIAARAMQAGLKLLKPRLVEAEVKSTGKVAIGTVKGDLHDIGKNLVKIMLAGAGFEVIDLGTNVSPQNFVEAVRANQAKYVGLSALLSSTMQNMKAVIDAIRHEPDLDEVRIIIGGAPVSREFAEAIGADGYAPNAASAVDVFKGMEAD
ncbi:MAG TPA: cobalamin-binding protein [Candidatus Marinimicrobia bacterium]|nr:cobalamin-binding protein [Candidatus Neomarinimicrobiota bacterium]